MRVRRAAVAAGAVACWVGSAAIVVSGFLGLSDMDRAAVHWSRLNSYLISLAVVLSVAWIVDRHVVTPRAAYRMGIEVGERRERRRRGGQDAEAEPAGPVRLGALRAVRDGGRPTSAR